MQRWAAFSYGNLVIDSNHVQWGENHLHIDPDIFTYVLVGIQVRMLELRTCENECEGKRCEGSGIREQNGRIQ
jgi:hypothetical protein